MNIFKSVNSRQRARGGLFLREREREREREYYENIMDTCNFKILFNLTISIELTEDGVSADDVQRIRDNLKDLDRFLGPYPYDGY